MEITDCKRREPAWECYLANQLLRCFAVSRIVITVWVSRLVAKRSLHCRTEWCMASKYRGMIVSNLFDHWSMLAVAIKESKAWIKRGGVYSLQ